jgi:hypothetical protein
MGATGWIIGIFFLGSLFLGFGLVVWLLVSVLLPAGAEKRTRTAWEHDFLELLTKAGADQDPSASTDQEPFDKELLDDLQDTLESADRDLRRWGRGAPSLRVSLTHLSDLCRLKPGVVKRRLGVSQVPDLRPTRRLIKRLQTRLDAEADDGARPQHEPPVSENGESAPKKDQKRGSSNTDRDSSIFVGLLGDYRKQVAIALLGGWLLCWATSVSALGNPPHWTNPASIILLVSALACLCGSVVALGVTSEIRRRRRTRKSHQSDPR